MPAGRRQGIHPHCSLRCVTCTPTLVAKGACLRPAWRSLCRLELTSALHPAQACELAPPGAPPGAVVQLLTAPDTHCGLSVPDSKDLCRQREVHSDGPGGPQAPGQRGQAQHGLHALGGVLQGRAGLRAVRARQVLSWAGAFRARGSGPGRPLPVHAHPGIADALLRGRQPAGSPRPSTPDLVSVLHGLGRLPQ